MEERRQQGAHERGLPREQRDEAVDLPSAVRPPHVSSRRGQLAAHVPARARHTARDAAALHTHTHGRVRVARLGARAARGRGRARRWSRRSGRRAGAEESAPRAPARGARAVACQSLR
eukprot:1010274-Prymnesium_polylepis.1